MNDVFRKSTRKEKVILFSLGILLIIATTIIFNVFIKKPLNEIENFVILLITPELGVLGIILILSNFNTKNKFIRSVLLILTGVLIGGMLFNNGIRYATFMFILAIIIVLVVVFFANAFITTFSLSLYSIVWMIIAGFLLFRYPNYQYAIIYSCITLGLITYLLFACKLNKYILKKFLGEAISNDYDSETLKENLTVIYIVIFIILNISAALYNDKFYIYALINNSFLTVITILQVRWEKIFRLK